MPIDMDYIKQELIRAIDNSKTPSYGDDWLALDIASDTLEIIQNLLSKIIDNKTESL